MKRFNTILPKFFSLLIAGIDGYAMYLLYMHEYRHRIVGTPLWGEEGELMTPILTSVGIIGIPLALIWFGEYISEFAEQSTEEHPYGDWAPTGLIKFVGWVWLSIPAVMLIWFKLK